MNKLDSERTSTQAVTAAATSPAKMAGRGGASLIAALMAGYSVAYMDQSMFSLTVMPLEKQFGLNTGQTGLIMSLFFLGFSLTQIPAGWLADRFGSKRVLMASLAACGIAAFLFGVVGGFALFILIRIVSGMGHGGYPAASSRTVADCFAPGKRTFAQSLLVSTSGIGGVLAYTLGNQLVAANWRVAYAVLGAFYVVGFLAVWIFVPGHKRVGAGSDDGRTAAGTAQDQDDATASACEKIGLREVIRDRNVIVLFAVMLLLNVVLFGDMSWQASFITTKFHITAVQSTWILSLNTVVCAVASLCSGSVMTRFFAGREKAAIAVSSLIGAGFTAAFAAASDLTVAALLMMCSSLAVMFAFTATFAWPHRILAERTIGSAIGVINTGSTLGGFIAPMVTGQIVNMSGGSFTPAFMFLAVVCALTAVAVQLVKVEAK